MGLGGYERSPSTILLGVLALHSFFCSEIKDLKKTAFIEDYMVAVVIRQSLTLMVGINVGVWTSHQLTCTRSLAIATMFLDILRRLSDIRTFLIGWLSSPFSTKNMASRGIVENSVLI